MPQRSILDSYPLSWQQKARAQLAIGTALTVGFGVPALGQYLADSAFNYAHHKAFKAGSYAASSAYQAANNMVGHLRGGGAPPIEGASLTTAPATIGIIPTTAAPAYPTITANRYGGNQVHHDSEATLLRERLQRAAVTETPTRSGLLTRSQSQRTSPPYRPHPGLLEPIGPSTMSSPTSVVGMKLYSPYVKVSIPRQSQRLHLRSPALPPKYIMRGGDPYLNNMYYPTRGASSYVKTSRKRRRRF
jgi:hypothetical protein